MNTFIETLNRTSEGLPHLAWLMFCQSSLLIVVVYAMDLLLRRKLRASVRYSLWLVVLIKLLLPPTLALPTGLAWWLLPGDAPPAPVQARQIIVTHVDNPIPFHRLPAPTTFAQPALRLSGQAWILIVAATISIALLMWLLVRWFQISRTVRQAGEPTDSLLAVLDEARRFIRIGPRTRLRLTNERMSPAVCGLFRPVILLPESLVENLPGSQLRAVLIHELVHLKRGDVWMNCLQALVQIVYWWHPLVWFGNARIRRVREEAVDDAVMLALRDEADCYAPTLLEVAKLAFHRPLASLGLVGILESRGALRQRIERLIDFKTPRRAGLSIVSTLAIVAFTAAAVPMGEAPPKAANAPQRGSVIPRVTVKNDSSPGTVFHDTNGFDWYLGNTLMGSSRGSNTPPLISRGFILDMEKFLPVLGLATNGLTDEKVLPEDFHSRFMDYFKTRGVDLAPPKHLFFHDDGRTWVWATAEDLGRMESILTTNHLFGSLSRTRVSPASRSKAESLVQDAKLLFELGKFDEMEAKLGEAIALDPQNAVAANYYRTLVHQAQDKKKISESEGYRLHDLVYRSTNEEANATSHILLAQNSIAPATQPAQATGPTSPLDSVLAFDKELKEATVNTGEAEAKFKFNLTNVSSFDVTITNILTSCGCTVAKMPASPWLLAPGATGEIPVTMNVAGKNGELTKTITLNSDRGTKTLTVKATIRSPEGAGSSNANSMRSQTATLVQDARLLYELGKLDDAEAKLGEALKLEPENAAAKYYLSLIQQARIHTNPPAPTRASDGLVRTYSDRKMILKKMEQIHFDRVSFDHLPLSEVVRFLSQQVRQRDPDHVGINFLINPQDASAPAATIDPSTGLPVPPSSNTSAIDIKAITITIPPLTNVRLADALEAIAKSADKPIKYSILDYAVVFSPLTESDRVNQKLFSRGFKVDPNTFIQAIEHATGIDFSKSLQTASTAAPQVFASGNRFVTTTNAMTEIQSAFITFFRSAGVDLSPPKSIFYGDRDGSLWVRATAQDLDIIEQVVQTQNTPTPQVTIRVKFIALDENIANALSLLWNQTNHSQTAAAPNAILTEPAMKDLMKALQNRAGVTELSDASVTTLSGRQAQIQMVEKKDVITTNPQTGLLRTNSVPCGPVLDVIPFVSADGYTIQMNVTPSLTEFLGYDDPQKVLPNGMKSPLPHFRVRQITTSAIVWDGQTVVLSRLPQTDVVTSNDTTSTNATAEDPKHNLLVLVTPTIIDPAGNRIHSDEQIDSLPATRR